MGIGEEDEEESSSAVSNYSIGGTSKISGGRRSGGNNINMPLPNDEDEIDDNDNKDSMIAGGVDSLLSADYRNSTTINQQEAARGEEPAATESPVTADDKIGGAPHHHHLLNGSGFVSRKTDATKLKGVVGTSNHSSRSEDDVRRMEEEIQQGDDGGVPAPAATADVDEEESITSTSQASSCATSQTYEDHDDDNGGENHSNKHQNDAEEGSHDEADENANFVPLTKKNHHRHVVEEHPRLHHDTTSTTFPQHLMDVIEQESQQDNNNGDLSILDWVEGGDAFLIRDKVAFERTVLPKYFSKNCKCKFISFVRKLYRWGFRQGKKLSSVGMTFAHPHFIRGDKQRCLRMRSIVKKPVLLRQLASDDISSTARVPPRFHPAAINSLVQHHHPLGLNALGHQQQSYGIINMAHPQVANLSALSSPLLVQLNKGQGLYPANGFIVRRGGNDGTMIAPPPSSYYWAPSSLQLHSTVPNPFPATSSAPVAFKPRTTMQHDLETLHRQRQQELVPVILGGINDGTRIGSYNQALLPGVQPVAAAVGYHRGIDTVRRLTSTTPGSFNVAVLTLASQMMKSDPSMEPRRALEIAKMCLPEPGTFGSLP